MLTVVQPYPVSIFIFELLVMLFIITGCMIAAHPTQGLVSS